MGGSNGRAGGRGALTAGVLVLGLALGVGGSWLLFGRQSPAGPPTTDARPPVELPVVEADPGEDTATATAASGKPAEPAVARSATEAVEAFFAAEVDADFARSFDYLSRKDQREHRSPAGWVAAHADIPPVTGFEVAQVRETGDGAEVDVSLTLESGIDEVQGLTPARAVGTWPLRRERGGWRLHFEQGTLRPVLPDPSAADEAAQRWYESRQACEQGDEVEGGLVGDAYLANDLCSAGGPVTAGAAEPLSDPTDVQPFDSAFGADAAAQLQVVALDGPVPLRAVLAPVEDRWQVVGLLPKSNIP